MSDEGRLVAGRYRVIKRIGAGAMGAVWQAHDEILHRTVAIKQLLLQPGLEDHEAEEARQRTMREGRIAARLHHPNAITVFDVTTDDNGQPCLIMEYLPSTSLAQELQQRTTLPPLEVARIGTQIAAALKEAHAVGIVHRDIKPGNILLAENGVVKLTDFGISRATDDVTVTKTGMIAGTPAYLAPEVAIGGNPGPESDVFSLGSTLYAATEGQPPFGLSENTLSLLHAVAAGHINPPRQSGPLTSVLAVMLHPDVRHRPTAAECEELLSAVANGETPLGAADEATRVHSAGGDLDDTAVLGTAGAGALAGALGAEAAHDAVPAAHAGTLGSADPYHPEEQYPRTSRYPGQDYDSRPRSSVQPTRAVPVGPPAAYDDYDDYDNDGRGGYADYDDYDDRPSRSSRGESHDDRRVTDAPEKGNWKIPAVIGTVVVAGMALFAIWLSGGFSGNPSDESPGDQRQVATTVNVPSSTTTQPATSTSEEPSEPAGPPPTSEQEAPPPEPTSDTEEVEPTWEPSETEEPSDTQATSTPNDSEPTTTTSNPRSTTTSTSTP